MRAILPILLTLTLTSLASTQQEQADAFLQPPYSQCWANDSDCSPAIKCKWDEFSQDSHLWLKDYENVRQAMEAAQQVIRGYSPEHIIRFDNPTEFHSTINYFCCHTPVAYAKMIKAMLEHRWSAINITYSEYVCNVDHNNDTIYITTRLDEDSNSRLLELVRGFEQAIEAAGVPVKHPRLQYFHGTLARVDPLYPTDKVLDILNRQHPLHESIVFDWFSFDLFEFHADTNSNRNIN